MGIESPKYVKTMVLGIFKKNLTWCFKSDLGVLKSGSVLGFSSL